MTRDIINLDHYRPRPSETEALAPAFRPSIHGQPFTGAGLARQGRSGAPERRDAVSALTRDPSRHDRPHGSTDGPAPLPVNDRSPS